MERKSTDVGLATCALGRLELLSAALGGAQERDDDHDAHDAQTLILGVRVAQLLRDQNAQVALHVGLQIVMIRHTRKDSQDFALVLIV